LHVYHTLTKPEGEGWVKSLFGKKKSGWSGWRGRIDAARIQELLNLHARTRKDDLFFLCGPGDFISSVDRALKDQGIADDHIKKEYFTAADPGPGHVREVKDQTVTSQVKVHLRGQVLD